jgi:hypothetical protein
MNMMAKRQPIAAMVDKCTTMVAIKLYHQEVLQWTIEMLCPK